MTASTGTTAQAVVFIAQATPSARPALASLPRPAQARTRQVSAIIGGSVTPTASGNAMSGEATATAVHQETRLRQSWHPRGRCGATAAKAAAISTTVVSVVQIRGSPRTPD